MAIPKMAKLTHGLEDGIYAAALTPMHADLSCDTQEFAFHCLDLMKRGCKGVLLFGTSGEGPSFSVKERLEALEKMIEKGLDPQKTILGNGGANIPETVELAKGAMKANCIALLVSPPPFFKNVSDEGVIAYYREVIQRVGDPKLRVLLYHIPQFTSVPITLKVIKALRLEFPDTVIGLKESEGNPSFVKEILWAYPGFKVFVANEKQIIEGVHAGAAGSICGIANLYPELICTLYEQGKKGDLTNPKELEEIFQDLRKHPFIPAAKGLMKKKRSRTWDIVRPPLMPI